VCICRWCAGWDNILEGALSALSQADPTCKIDQRRTTVRLAIDTFKMNRIKVYYEHHWNKTGLGCSSVDIIDPKLVPRPATCAQLHQSLLRLLKSAYHFNAESGIDIPYSQLILFLGSNLEPSSIDKGIHRPTPLNLEEGKNSCATIGHLTLAFRSETMASEAGIGNIQWAFTNWWTSGHAQAYPVQGCPTLGSNFLVRGSDDLTESMKDNLWSRSSFREGGVSREAFWSDWVSPVANATQLVGRLITLHAFI
jgi:hypothetical protein